MKARHTILTIAAIAMLAAPTAVLAQSGPGDGGGWGGGPGRHGGRGWDGGGDGGHGLRIFERMLPRLAERLELSDEQLAEIQTIVDEARPQIDELTAQLRAGRDEYRGADPDPTFFDETAFRAHAEAQHEIQTELGVVVGLAKANAFKVLTPEQLEELEEIRGEFGKSRSRRGSGRRSTN